MAIAILKGKKFSQNPIFALWILEQWGKKINLTVYAK